jgi:hypothetical protein
LRLVCARRPDFIKASTSAFSEWHYIDLAYAPAGDGGVAPSCGAAQQNIVWALEAAAAVLRSPKSDGWSRSTMLRFLIHFMGDIHQARARACSSDACARRRASERASELSSPFECARAHWRGMCAACAARRGAWGHSRRGDASAPRRRRRVRPFGARA